MEIVQTVFILKNVPGSISTNKFPLPDWKKKATIIKTYNYAKLNDHIFSFNWCVVVVYIIVT